MSKIVALPITADQVNSNLDELRLLLEKDLSKDTLNRVSDNKDSKIRPNNQLRVNYEQINQQLTALNRLYSLDQKATISLSKNDNINKKLRNQWFLPLFLQLLRRLKKLLEVAKVWPSTKNFSEAEFQFINSIDKEYSPYNRGACKLFKSKFYYYTVDNYVIREIKEINLLISAFTELAFSTDSRDAHQKSRRLLVKNINWARGSLSGLVYGLFAVAAVAAAFFLMANPITSPVVLLSGIVLGCAALIVYYKQIHNYDSSLNKLLRRNAFVLRSGVVSEEQTLKCSNCYFPTWKNVKKSAPVSAKFAEQILGEVEQKCSISCSIGFNRRLT